MDGTLKVFGGTNFTDILINATTMPSEFKQNLRASIVDAWNSSSVIANFNGSNYALYGVKFIYAEPNASEITTGELVKFNISSDYVSSNNVTFSIDGFEFVSATPAAAESSYVYNLEIQGNTLNVKWNVVNNSVDYKVVAKANSTRYLTYSLNAKEENGTLEYNDSILVLFN